MALASDLGLGVRVSDVALAADGERVAPTGANDAAAIPVVEVDVIV